MPDQVTISGVRDVRATLDRPEAGPAVVACPPHPQMGGSRSDTRLRAVSDALGPDVACLRIDYGPWDEGRGERDDAMAALAWASERHDTVGLFGYSFGGSVALLAAATADPAAVSALAPADRLDEDLDAVAALERIDCPVQVVSGERDTTVDSGPVAAAARERGHAVETLPADHFYVGRTAEAGTLVAEFLREHL